jgi:hypothetical protein
MDRLKKLILKCNNCHNFYRLTLGRWSSLLGEFRSSKEVIKNYICNKCITTAPMEFRTRKKVIEHVSSEEVSVMKNTVSTRDFSPKYIVELIRKHQLSLVIHKSPKHIVHVLTPERVDLLLKEISVTE